jgi:signal transduction histidine kinase
MSEITDNSTKSYLARLRAMAVRLADIREIERRKLSKDLHGIVGHELGLARIKLSEILRSGRIDIPEELSTPLSDVEKHLKEAVRQTRSIGYEYFPQVLDDAGLLPALRWLADEYTERHDFKIDVSLSEECEQITFSHELRSRLFTAIRECVYNAWKYAEADKIEIQLLPLEYGRMQIIISDNGKGFDVGMLDQMDRVDGGFGLFSIREIIEHQGGRFHCNSAPEKGTTITMTIPPEHIEELILI